LDPVQRIRHARGEVGPRAAAAVEEVVARRLSGQPLAYALGRWEFGGLVFVVTPDVLVPRPETEFLVARGDEYLREVRRKQPTLLDLGCGSGCVGLTLAVRYPRLHVTLTDVSEPALGVARENAQRLGIGDRASFKAGDWFAAVKRRERFDAVLCNPPYVTRRDDPRLSPEVSKHEPSLALFLDQDPTEFYFRLARKAVSHLVSGGLFAVEVGYDTAWPARCGFEKVNALTRGHEVHDFSGLERVIWGIRR
jgi:release factor glutamine methyltransferase